MKRFALAALLLAALTVNSGCQHCCWTIFPDVAACGPGLGCGERYYGDLKAEPDPCQCGYWVGDGHASYNKWGRRDDGGGCDLGGANCGCSSCGGCSTCAGGHVATSDCGCGETHGGTAVYYEE